MGDVRRRPSRPPPDLVPEELEKVRAKCPLCRTLMPIPWNEKLEFPKQPVAPKDSLISLRPGYWVPIDFPLKCPRCALEFRVPIPDRPRGSECTLYGDEAFRYINNHIVGNDGRPIRFACITIVGMHRDGQVRLRSQLDELKREIVPDRLLSEWSLHFTDIWSSSPSDGSFALSSKADKIALGKRLAEIIRETTPKLVFLNTSGWIKTSGDDPRQWKKDRKALFHDVFSLSLSLSLHLFRKSGDIPRWVFDNIQDTSNGDKVEGWAQEIFLGLQYTRLFQWLSAGATILEPKFRQPGTHFLSEVADFISYCVAREFEKTMQGAKTEFPTKQLGMGHYAGIIQDGSVIYDWYPELPMKQFYNVG